VNQARIENQSPNSKRPSGLDERVLPDLKANIKNSDSESKQRAKFRKVAARREDPRRQSRGLRSLWNVLVRNNELERHGSADHPAPSAADLTSAPRLEPDMPVPASLTCGMYISSCCALFACELCLPAPWWVSQHSVEGLTCLKRASVVGPEHAKILECQNGIHKKRRAEKPNVRNAEVAGSMNEDFELKSEVKRRKKVADCQCWWVGRWQVGADVLMCWSTAGGRAAHAVPRDHKQQGVPPRQPK